MHNWLLTSWDYIRTNLLLIPSLMILIGVALAVAMLQVDLGHGSEDEVRAWWINSGDGEDARNLLSTLLSSVITMATMAFSVTVVALTLAANTYGSRLVRIFRADLRTQAVLGTFAMTIIYSLIVLRSIHGKSPIPDVPHAAVTVGTLLALFCVLALLGFIQGVARAIVAEEVVRRVRHEIDSAIAELPELDDAAPAGAIAADIPNELHQHGERIPLTDEGYIQAVDYAGLLDWAQRHDRLLHIELRAGDFLVRGDRRIRVYPPTRNLAEASHAMGRFVVTGDERTPTQDLEFGIRHLVEIAVRAMSPGINDPFTATAVLDRLRATLTRLMNRQLPTATLSDGEGRVRLYRRVTTLEGLFDSAFHQIRQTSSAHPAVLIHMLDTIALMTDHARLPAQREALLQHARLIRTAAERDVPDESDRHDVDRAFKRVLEMDGQASERV